MKNRTFTEKEFKKAVANSHSIRQTLICLGLCAQGGGAYRAFHNAVKDWNVDTSHFKGQGWNKGNRPGPVRDLSEYFSNKYPINSHRLRKRLLKEGYFEAKCSVCNLTNWNEKPIPLELDHINGNHEDNSLDNLRIICPNCHAQQPTHAGKNKGTYSKS